MQLMPNTITYSAASSACEKGQQWITATTWLREMQQWHMKLDAIAYSAASSACEKGHEWEGSLVLLCQLQEARLKPDSTTYSASILTCSRSQKWHISLELLRNFWVQQDDSMKVDMQTCRDVASACERSPRSTADRVLMQVLCCSMESLPLSVTCYTQRHVEAWKEQRSGRRLADGNV